MVINFIPNDPLARNALPMRQQAPRPDRGTTLARFVMAGAVAPGLYPPGTVMMTSSGHIIVSTSPNPDDLARPKSRVMVLPDGKVQPGDGGAVWDPMPPDEHVTRVLRPEEQEVSATEYLAA